MIDEEKAEEYADKILFGSKHPFIFNKEKVKAYIVKVYLESLKCCEEAYNKGLAEGRKEFEEKISVLLSCKNCSENKGGWICVKEYENKCLAQKIEFIKELEKEKCELLGIIQGKDKVIQELKKELNSMLVSKNQQLAKAKEIIEKMKCCENCRHYSHTYGHCYSYDEYQNCKSLSNWRLAEC